MIAAGRKSNLDGLVEAKNLTLSGSAVVPDLHSKHPVEEEPIAMEMLPDSFRRLR
jgi:hypothetical protein